MPMIHVKDNSDVTQYQENPIVQELLDRDLSDLTKENFIIFPPQLEASEDLDGENYIFDNTTVMSALVTLWV